MGAAMRGANGETKRFVIAHRGDATEVPENSLEAFEKAIAVGSDMIEFDVRRTKDDRLIAYHNADVTGIPIRELSHEEIGQKLGRTPPLLGEVIDIARGRIKLDVELKEDGYVDWVLATITERFEPEELLITSFLDKVVEQAKRAKPAITAGLLLGQEEPEHVIRTRLGELFPVARAKRCGADCIAPHYRLARWGAVTRANAAEYPAVVWTLNEDDQLRQYLADERVLGVITDVPTRALDLREEIYCGETSAAHRDSQSTAP